MKHCKICNRLLTEAEIHTNVKYCCKHYNQIKKYGKPLDNNPRSLNDFNEVRIFKDYAEIDTYNLNGEVLHTYKVDIEDLPILYSQKKWRSTIKGVNIKRPYLISNNNIYFHRAIMGFYRDIDHINRDTLDNRKSNIRVSDRHMQGLNTVSIKSIKGVYSDKRDNTWFAGIKILGKQIWSPRYKDFASAVFFRYLLDELFCFPLNIHSNNEVEMNNIIQTLDEDKKTYIEKYFRNRFKDRV